MTSATRWSLAVAAESLLIVFMLPLGLTYTGFLFLHQAQVGLLALFGGIGWVAIIRRPSALPIPLVLAPLPLLVALAISSVMSHYPTLSWYATWQTAAYVGIGWLLALQASRPAGRRNLIAVIGIVVTAALVSYLMDLVVAWREWLALGFPLTSLPLRPLNSGGLALIPTWLADLIATGSPVVIAALWTVRARVLSIVLAVVVLGEIVLSGTRSVLLIVVALAVVAIVALVRVRGGRRAAAIAAALAIAIGAAGLSLLLRAARELDEGRSSAYASAIDRFRSSPLLGTGPGTFGVSRMSDPVDTLRHLAYPDAHNIVLTTLAETGILGAIGLGIAVALFGLAARRAWREAPANRPIIAGALFGIGVFASHGMVDVVFAVVGIVVVVIAVIAIAATHDGPPRPEVAQRSWPLRAVMAAGLIVVVLSSGLALRGEMTFGTLDEADSSLPNSPSVALDLATEATATSPDYVPAWWVQMVAADASGDAAGAITAARKIVDLEGFGQEWMNLAVLASQSGDQTVAHDAIGRATGQPPEDPIVELNAAVLLDAAGDARGAEAAATLLLGMQPAIEPVLQTGPLTLARLVARLRPDVALARLRAGDPESAFVIALSGEDRPLAARLLDIVNTTDRTAVDWWRSVVDGWFGDAAAAAAIDQSAQSGTRLDRLLWAWRIAAHTCDQAGAARWERGVAIAFSYLPSAPVTLGVAPDFQARMLPQSYPAYIWRLDHPNRPYVAGTWTLGFGRPSCAGARG